MANSPSPLSAHQLRELSVKACVHPSTAMRWLAGQRCHDDGAQRLARAAADLGIALPAPVPMAISTLPEAS